MAHFINFTYSKHVYFLSLSLVLPLQGLLLMGCGTTPADCPTGMALDDEGQCVSAKVCSDGTLVPTTALCPPEPEDECVVDVDCDDANACTIDACDQTTHTCEHTSVECAATGNECTIELCDPSVGCALEELDDITCNADQGVCQQGECLTPTSFDIEIAIPHATTVLTGIEFTIDLSEIKGIDLSNTTCDSTFFEFGVLKVENQTISALYHSFNGFAGPLGLARCLGLRALKPSEIDGLRTEAEASPPVPVIVEVDVIEP